MDPTAPNPKIVRNIWADFGRSVQQTLSQASIFAKQNPHIVKRIVKTGFTVSAAIALTIIPTFGNIWGVNPFLIGTTAIYLFPIKSVGGQIVATITALLGALCGLTYSNLILFLARLSQDSAEDHVIHSGRRAILWTSFLVGAWMCGYLRSKDPRSYLFIVFFMMVNMFALIRGISDFDYVFRRFFNVMVVGASLSMLVSLCLWPEDHSRVLKGNMESALFQARQTMLDIEKSVGSKEYTEVNASSLAAAVKRLATSFQESNYEISLSRVDARDLLFLSAKLETLLEAVKIYNCTVRGRSASLALSPPQSPDTKEKPSPCVVSEIETKRQKVISFAFLEAVRVIDMITERLKNAYEGQKGTKDIPVMEVAGFQRHKDDVEHVLCQGRENRTELEVGYSVEGVAFMDLLSTIIVDVLDTVYEAAQASNKITSTGRRRCFWPIGFRGDRAKKCSGGGPTSCEATPSGLGADTAEFAEFEDEVDETTTALVQLSPTEKWYIMLWLAISRSLSRVKRSRHVKYAIKFAIVMGVLSCPAYFKLNYIWYENMRAQWALISAMIAMETTRGMTFRTAGMKVCGAVAGGLSAFATMQITSGIEGGVIVVSFFIGMIIGYLVNNATFAKAGTVFALAFNIIIGVAQTSSHHDTNEALARRLITLPIGLFVAMVVHLGIFPFHARAQLAPAISTSMDWLHNLLYAIEMAGEEHRGDYSKPAVRFVTEDEFQEVVDKTKKRVRFANTLVPSTRYEISLAGHFPVEKFEKILERLAGIVLLIVGTGKSAECGPVMLDPQDAGQVEAWGRDKLIGSMCNDLLVISHTLSARLYMPRHSSYSSIALADYIRLFCNTTQGLHLPSCTTSPVCTPIMSSPQKLIIPTNFKSSPTAVSTANYADVGRLVTLVNEMNLLRDEVDDLITQSLACPRTKEMFPRLSASVYHLASVSRFASSKRLDLERDGVSIARNGLESRDDSQAGSRTPPTRPGGKPGSRGGSGSISTPTSPKTFKPLRKPEKARSSSGERWCEGCVGCGKCGRKESPDRSSFV